MILLNWKPVAGQNSPLLSAAGLTIPRSGRRRVARGPPVRSMFRSSCKAGRDDRKKFPRSYSFSNSLPSNPWRFSNSLRTTGGKWPRNFLRGGVRSPRSGHCKLPIQTVNQLFQRPLNGRRPGRQR